MIEKTPPNWQLLVKNKWLVRLSLCGFLLLLSLYASLPVLRSGFYPVGDPGTDLPFHLLRVQGLAENIQRGQLLPAINPVYLEGFGYPVDLFYGSLPLYLPAGLIALGWSLTTAVKAYVVVVTCLTAGSMYGVSKALSRNRHTAMLATSLYTLGNYRFWDIFCRGSLGSIATFIFLPLVLLGIVEIIKGNPKHWYWLTIGFCGVLLSHLVTAFVMVFCLLVAVIFSWRSFWQEKVRFSYLFLAGILAVLLTAIYTFPMFEQMRSYSYNAKINPTVSLASREGSFSFWKIIEHSLNGERATSYCLSFAIVLFLLFRLLLKKQPETKASMHLADHLALSGLLITLAASYSFPWTAVVKLFPPINSIQFPFRFIPLALPLLAYAAGQYATLLSSQLKRKHLCFGLCLLAVVLFGYDSIDYYQVANQPDHVTAELILDTYDIGSGKEYLPVDTDITWLAERGTAIQATTGTVELSKPQRQGTTMTFDYQQAQQATLELPYIYYKGYVATIDGKQQPLSIGSNHLMEVQLTGKQGQVKIAYRGTRIQKVSAVLSLLGCVLLLLCIFYQRKQSPKMLDKKALKNV